MKIFLALDNVKEWIWLVMDSSECNPVNVQEGENPDFIWVTVHGNLPVVVVSIDPEVASHQCWRQNLTI